MSIGEWVLAGGVVIFLVALSAPFATWMIKGDD